MREPKSVGYFVGEVNPALMAGAVRCGEEEPQEGV